MMKVFVIKILRRFLHQYLHISFIILNEIFVDLLFVYCAFHVLKIQFLADEFWFFRWTFRFHDTHFGLLLLIGCFYDWSLYLFSIRLYLFQALHRCFPYCSIIVNFQSLQVLIQLLMEIFFLLIDCTDGVENIDCNFPCFRIGRRKELHEILGYIFGVFRYFLVNA